MTEIQSPELVEEGDHLVVRIPLTFKRRGGRKEIITTGCQASESPRSCRTNKPLVVAIARAHRWKGLIEGGRYATVAEMAAAMGMDASYVARILRLSLLAPDIVEAIMRGDEPSGLSLARLLDIPPYWTEQRKKWEFPPR
jgi:hypothetical protein